MADEPDIEDDTLELGEPPEQDAPEEEAQSPETPPAEDDDGEIAIEIEGDEDEPEAENATVRQLREELKRVKRERAELTKFSAPAKIEVGEKPTLESSEWDEEKFERDLDAWKERKRQAETQGEQAEEAQRASAREFTERHASYKARAAALPVQGFKEAEDKVIEALPESMQGILVRYFPDAEKVVLALGRNPKHLDAISSINDPVAQLLALKDFAGKIKMVKRNAPPPPEERISGTGKISAGGKDKEAERLLEKGSRTGDLTEYNRYVRSKRAAKK